MQEFIERRPEPDSIKIEDLMGRFGVGEERAKEMKAQYLSERLFVNDTYQVSMSQLFRSNKLGWPDFLHLSIIRLDLQEVRSWSDMQEIKNQLVGPDYEAIEVFPAESRRVDMGNAYHLWVFIGDRGFAPVTVPVGWMQRQVRGEPNEES